MPKPIDLTGQQFGRLTVIERAENRNKSVYWLCRCSCGSMKVVSADHLRRGTTRSCGCLRNFDGNKGRKVVNARRRIKIALVEAFGHKCAACGLVDNPVLYDFHHLNPDEKEFGLAVGRTTRSKDAYVREAKKCVMLCSNCHRRIENGLINQSDINVIPLNEQIYWQTLDSLMYNADTKMAR